MEITNIEKQAEYIVDRIVNNPKLLVPCVSQVWKNQLYQTIYCAIVVWEIEGKNEKT